MSRKWIVALLAGGVFLAAAPGASAGTDPVTVKPNPVKQGKKLKIIAEDCISGPGYKAYVEVSIIEKGDGKPIIEKRVPADADGTTLLKFKIKKSKFPAGKYWAYVDCIHVFDAGGEGVWYETDNKFKVKAAD